MMYLFTRFRSFLKHVVDGRVEGRTEVTGRRGGLKEKRDCCKLKEEALDRTLWRNDFGGIYGPAVRQPAE